MATSLPGSAFNRYVPGEKSPNADATLARIDSNLENASAPAEISRQAASNVNETMKASNPVGGAFLPADLTQETGVAETPQASPSVPTSQNAKSDTSVQQEGFLSRILSGIKSLIAGRGKEAAVSSQPAKETPVGAAFFTTSENSPIELLGGLLGNIKQQLTAETVSAPRPSVGETQETTSQGTTAPVPVSASPTAKTPENVQSAGLLSRILSGVKNRFAPPVGLPSSAPTEVAEGASKQENAGPSPATVSTGFVNLMGWILNGVRAKFKAPVGAPPSVSLMTTDKTTTTKSENEKTERTTSKETISSQTLQSVLSTLTHASEKTSEQGKSVAAEIFETGLANLQNVATDILREVKDGASSLSGGGMPTASAETAAETNKTTVHIPNQNDAANFVMSQAKGINATVPTKQQPTELYKPPVMLPDSGVSLISGPTTTLHDPNQTTLHAPADDNRTALHTGSTPDQNRTTLHVPQEPVMMELDPLANKIAGAISGLKSVVGGSVPVGGKSFDSTDKGTSKSDLLNPFGLGDFLRTLKDKVGPTPIGQGASQVKDAMSDVPFSLGGETSNAGDIMGGLGKLASAIPIIGKPIEAMGKLGEVTLNSIGKLKDWTENLHSANMQFAEFSASMAEVQAEQMVRDIDLSRERGERRADSAKYLAESKSDLASTTAPIADLFANAKNYIGGALSQVTSTLLKPLSLIAKLLQKDSDKGDKSEINMGEWLAEMGKKGYFETYGTLDRSPFDVGDPRNR